MSAQMVSSMCLGFIKPAGIRLQCKDHGYDEELFRGASLGEVNISRCASRRRCLRLAQRGIPNTQKSPELDAGVSGKANEDVV